MLTPPDAVSATGEYHVIVINGVSMDGRITQAKINIVTAQQQPQPQQQNNHNCSWVETK